MLFTYFCCYYNKPCYLYIISHMTMWFTYFCCYYNQLFTYDQPHDHVIYIVLLLPWSIFICFVCRVASRTWWSRERETQGCCCCIHDHGQVKQVHQSLRICYSQLGDQGPRECSVSSNFPPKFHVWCVHLWLWSTDLCETMWNYVCIYLSSGFCCSMWDWEFETTYSVIFKLWLVLLIWCT